MSMKPRETDTTTVHLKLPGEMRSVVSMACRVSCSTEFPAASKTSVRMLQCHKDENDVSLALVQESLIIEEALTADSSTK